MLNLIKLKIKAKSLSEEARIIRKEERKLKGAARVCIAEHRRWNVRNEARATYLAIAYLKNKPYKLIEPSCKDTGKRDQYIVRRVLSMAKKYGPHKHEDTLRQEVSDWFSE